MDLDKLIGTLPKTAWSSIKSSISTVQTLDTAFAELKKTTSATSKELEAFYRSANSTAKELGTSTEAVMQATTNWTKLGYSIQDAQKMAKTSTVFDNISSDLDISSATKGLSSAMKAFHVDVNDTLDGIISKISTAQNTWNVSANDIVTVLTQSSSEMADANNTLEQTLALGAAAIDITGNADTASEALNTISMRIRGYDTEVGNYTADLANLDAAIAGFTQTAAAPNGISLYTDATKQTQKSSYQLLSDISDIYPSMSSENQTNLAEALGGDQQAKVISAMIANFDSVEASIQIMANSAGTAMSEMNTSTDSLNYKLNQLSETGTGIAQNLFHGSEMNAIVDGLTAVAGAVETITGKLGLLNTAAVAIGGFTSLKNQGRLNSKSHSLFNCFEYARHAQESKSWQLFKGRDVPVSSAGLVL